MKGLMATGISLLLSFSVLASLEHHLRICCIFKTHILFETLFCSVLQSFYRALFPVFILCKLVWASTVQITIFLNTYVTIQGYTIACCCDSRRPFLCHVRCRHTRVRGGARERPSPTFCYCCFCSNCIIIAALLWPWNIQ